MTSPVGDDVRGLGDTWRRRFVNNLGVTLSLLQRRMTGMPRTGPIAVVRVRLHVQFTQTTLLVVERLFLHIGHRLPLRTKDLADARIVHVRTSLEHVASLRPRPHHERVHWSLYVFSAFGHASSHAPEIAS